MPVGTQWDGDVDVAGNTQIDFRLSYQINGGPPTYDMPSAAFVVKYKDGGEAAAIGLEGAYTDPRHYSPDRAGKKVDFTCGHMEHAVFSLEVNQGGQGWQHVPASPYQLTLPCGLKVSRVND